VYNTLTHIFFHLLLITSNNIKFSCLVRELHGDGDDNITAVYTAVMGLDFMTDTAVIIAGMGTAVTVVPRYR